jgi:hypothetical protein
MACCIYVAFLFSRLLAALEAVRRFFGGKPEDKTAAARAWRLDLSEQPAAPLSPTAAEREGRRRRNPSPIAVVAVVLALMVAVGIWFT